MGGAKINPNRAQALKLALEQIDSHLGEYDTAEKQQQMLQVLIAEHQLKDQPKNLKGALIDLTVERYSGHLTRALSEHPMARSRTRNGKDMYTQGSALLDQAYVTKLGVQRPGNAANDPAVQAPIPAPPPPRLSSERIKGIQDSGPVPGQASTTAQKRTHDELENPKQPKSKVLAMALAQARDKKQKTTHDTNSIPVQAAQESSSSARKRSAHEAAIEIEDDDTSPKKQRVRESATAVEPKEPQPSELARKRSADQAVVNVDDDQAAPSPKRQKIQESAVAGDSGEPQPSGLAHKRSAEKAVIDVDEDELAPSPKRQKIQDTATAGASGTQMQSLLASSIARMGYPGVGTELHAIKVFLESLAVSILIGVGVDGHDKAKWSPEPTKELEKVYRELFGEDWKRRTAQVMKGTGSPVALFALVACMSAAIYGMVFQEELPWAGPKETCAMLKDDLPFVDQWLRFRNQSYTHETLIWHAAQSKATDAAFRKNVIKPAADEIAARIMLILDQHLDAQGAKKGSEGDLTPDEFWEAQTATLSTQVENAIALKGKLRAAPDYFEFQWVESGTAFDARMMEDMRGANIRTEGREVAWCNMPFVRARATKSSEWQVASRATVYTRMTGGRKWA